MRRYAALVLLVLLLTVMLVFTLGACEGYKSFLPERPVLDNSVPLMNGFQITNLSADKNVNPDRGLRYELYVTLNEGGRDDYWAFPDAMTTDANGAEVHVNAGDYATETINYYKTAFSERPLEYNTAQVYVYLIEYYDRELTSKALAQLGFYLERLRSTGIRAVLRFAYEYNSEDERGPSSATIYRHMEQLGEWFTSSATIKNLIKDTVFVFQAGFVGLWGEWHSAKHAHDTATVLSRFYNMVPPGYHMQVRTSEIRVQAPVKAMSELGYHDDFELGHDHEWHTAGAKRNSDGFETFLKQSPTLINDGEMPWGSWSAENGEYVDGKNFIKSMLEHRYATFSAVHNFIEKKPDGTYGDYSMNRWRAQYITETDIIALGAPYYPNYFKDSAGNTVSRTVYDYVQDHLGYQLAASHLTVDDRVDPEGDGRVALSTVQFTINNFGVGAPLTLNLFEVVFARKKDDGSIEILDRNTNSGLKAFHTDVVQPQWNTVKLTAYGQLKIILADFRRNKGYAVGIRISTGGSKAYCVRLANDIPYYNGVNFIYDYEQLRL